MINGNKKGRSRDLPREREKRSSNYSFGNTLIEMLRKEAVP